MKISVILTTARLGGFDVLLDSIVAQEFDDFEVVVCDEFAEERKALMRDKRIPMRNWNFNNGFEKKFQFVHLAPKRECAIYDDSLGVNTALAAASGELIVILADFTWAPPGYLQTHWDFYKANPGWSMSCYLDRYELPPIKDGPHSIERDWWSVFKEDFSPSWFDGKEPAYRERRGSVGKVHPDGKVEIPGAQTYLLGDSVPTTVAKELNGIDERLIGGYSANDICFGMRANVLGWKWALNPHVKLKKLTLSGQNQIPSKYKPRIRAPEDNYRFAMNRIAQIKAGKESLKVPTGWGAWD